MRFISVVPAIRTPFGVDAFDYRVADGSDIRVGDLVPVPFRTRQTAALVVASSPHSAFADRIMDLRGAAPLVRFPAGIVPLLDRSAARAFVSRPTVLHSWLRTVPKRLQPLSVGMRAAQSSLLSDRSEWTTDRIARVERLARAAQGRVLVLSPWRLRAETIAGLLDAPVLHADMALVAAWRAWTAFLGRPSAILVATRAGAWLSAFADAVVIEEPENDDYKSDELTPRLDARWIVRTANEYRPSLSVFRVGTTPPLACGEGRHSDNAPDIPVRAAFAPFQSKGRSNIEGLTLQAVEACERAVRANRHVIIVHPIRGERSRVACRDCGWVAACGNCGFSVTRTSSGMRCARCGKTGLAPVICPNCGGADLGKGRAGRDRMAADVRCRFGDRIRVVDLPEWNSTLIAHRSSLIIVTDLSLIGGAMEDVRRRERLVIAWRRLAADIRTNDGEILVQGAEDLLDEARAWLTEEGVRKAWLDECRERTAFGYPPARPLVKLIRQGSESDGTAFAERLRAALPESWDVRGPFPVAFRPKASGPRTVIHVLPPAGAPESALQEALEPFARDVIIDLDPIAFLR